MCRMQYNLSRSVGVVPAKSRISASSRSDDPDGRSWLNPRFQGTTGRHLSEMPTFGPVVSFPLSVSAFAIMRQLNRGRGEPAHLKGAVVKRERFYRGYGRC